MRNLFTNHFVSIPHERFTLVLFSDVHYGVKACDTDRFKWMIKKTSALENPYYLGVGDYQDFASYSTNKKLAEGQLHETEDEWIDTQMAKQTRELAEIMAPMKGRIWGLIGGNHQYRMQNGKMTDEYLCELLDTKYLGWLSVIKVLFPSCAGVDQMLSVFACHGKQGGKLLGTSLNAVVDMAQIIPNADIYVQGHDHQRMAVPKSVMMIKTVNNENKFKLQQRRQYFCRSGSFQKSYAVNTSGFAQARLMKPSDLGSIYLNISTHRNYDPHEVILDIEATI